MADQAVAVPLEISSSELFSGATEPEPRQEAAPEREPENDGQPRDEHGRFAPKTEQEEPVAPAAAQQEEPVQQPQAPTDDDKSGHVPSWRLRQETEERRAFEQRWQEEARQRAILQQQFADAQRRIEQLQQPKQDPVDFYADPEAAFKQRLNPLEERQARFEQSMRLTVSRAMAIATHGAQAVSEMDQALEKASRENHPDLPALTAQLRASDDPVGVAIQWHKRSKLLEETGGDLTSYRQKALDDALNDPAFLAKAMERARAQASGQQQPGSRPAINLPPSLNKAPGSGVTNTELDDADMSSGSLFKNAVSNRR
jgi:hypothetical protein